MNLPTSERLRFSSWTLNDLDTACELWGDPNVMARIDSRGGLNREQVAEKLKIEISWQEEFGIQYWKVSSKESGEALGACGLRPCGWWSEPGSIELGFHFMHKHWGKGYAGEAARAVIEFAFEKMKLQRLFAGHHPENIASQKVLQKFGFQSLGSILYAPTGLHHPIYQLAF